MEPGLQSGQTGEGAMQSDDAAEGSYKCRGVLPIRITVKKGHTMFAVGAAGGGGGGGVGSTDFFSPAFYYPFRSPCLRETARYILKWCLKEPSNPKQQQLLLFLCQQWKYDSFSSSNNIICKCSLPIC